MVAHCDEDYEEMAEDAYHLSRQLGEVEVDECTATGGMCQFVSLSVPSVYVAGKGDGEPCDVIQCKYCGGEISDE